MKIDFQGNALGADFYEAIMRSHARITYGEAQEVIDGNTPDEFKHIEDVILRASDLAKILMAKRFREGSLDLEIPETELLIDKTGTPFDIQRTERIFAHKLIEEMMLAANVAVAKFIGEEHKVPVLYRIHDQPKRESIEILNHYLKNFGSNKKLTGKNLQKEIGRALQDFAGKPEEIILHILTLRSMNQAKYSPENIGHFGLGFDYYTHFTSPIRRYPDLIVHRVLKNVLGIEGYECPAMDTLETAGTFLSACEQRSVKAERHLHSIKKARFMQKYLGEEFEGIISSVAKFGIFVLLRQFDVDGLIKVEELGNDMFIYDAENMILFGKRSGFKYSIGDTLKIQVASCDPDLGQINFVLVNKPQILQGSRGHRDDRGQGLGKRERNNDRESQHKGKHKSGKGDFKRGDDKKGDRSNFKERRKNENNRRGASKARVSKRSRKGKTR
jgi:ribonuclease R